MSNVGSSEPGPDDAADELSESELIKQASRAISALRNRYCNAVKDFPGTSQSGESKESMASIVEMQNEADKGQQIEQVRLKSQGLDKLREDFELIFPHVPNKEDIQDAVSLRKDKRNLSTVEEQKRQIVDLQYRLQRQTEECGKVVNDGLVFKSQLKEVGRLYEELRAEHEQCPGNRKKHADKLPQVKEENKKLLSKLAADNQKLAQEIQSIEALNRQLADEKENTERRNVSLEKQIAEVEGERSKQSVAGGVYSSSEADPTTLGTAALDIKCSLVDFARTLMEDMPARAKTDFVQRHHAGITFSGRKTDIKYVFQAWAAQLVFQGLWESDSFSYNCLPVGQEVEETQKFHFNRYRQLKGSPDILGRLKGSTCGQCSGVCHCGWMDFKQFFVDKCGALKDSGKDMVEVSMGSDTPLLEDLVALLTNVWLAHLLTLAFEQPATLFKVKSGSKFVPAHMEPTMLEVEPTTDDLTVAFMIIPGFRVGKSVIKSLVYVSPVGTPSEPNDLVATQASSSQLAASNDDMPHKDNLLPPQKQLEGLARLTSLSKLTFKVYRIHPTKKAGSVLKLRGGDGKYHFPQRPWNEDLVTTKGKILSWLQSAGALPAGEADVLEQAEGDCWEMLVRYQESKLMPGVQWEHIQDCPFGPLANQSASTKAKKLFRR